MKFCVQKNLKRLRKCLEQDQIFSKKLKNPTFLCILEILYNTCGGEKQSRKWLSKAKLKELKKWKKLLRFLFDDKKTIRKRKKKFLKSEQEFQRLIHAVLELFYEKCVESN